MSEEAKLTEQEAMEQVAQKVKEASKLISEAEKLARKYSVPFSFGLVEEDSDGYVSGVAGWIPSGLNC